MSHPSSQGGLLKSGRRGYAPAIISVLISALLLPGAGICEEPASSSAAAARTSRTMQKITTGTGSYHLTSSTRTMSISVPQTTGTRVFKLDRTAEDTCFQCAAPYAPRIDIRSDVAIVYGIDDTLSSRIEVWKRHGYRTHVMTGAAWGGYVDYIEGRFDGKPHDDEGQVDGSGKMIMHDPKVPYMVPSESFTEYLTALGKRAVDAGASALHLEEPEFWSHAGYSESFKRLWKQEYGQDWSRPDASAEASWRSAKLKYSLYRRHLDQVFKACKEYAASKEQNLLCYVPTHSLINYTQFGIVSPESSLMDLRNCDGYIAQVWTGTARVPNIYRGVKKERPFEAAFFEYGSMYSMVASSGRKVFFLADPVEDDPKHTWDDYRRNYERVIVASLLYPEVYKFEVMPWPDRIFGGRYKAGTYDVNPDKLISIPPEYCTEILTVVNALNDMQQTRLRWECGSRDVGVALSDTMMFQRGGISKTDPALAFFGLALPLIKNGVVPRCVVLERLLEQGALEDINYILLSYDFMKPLKPEYHDLLSHWVQAGGTLVYIGEDSDPFNMVREWWNTGELQYASPREDLFARMKLPKGTGPGIYKIGDGWMAYSRESPAKLASSADGATSLTDLLSETLEKSDRRLMTTNYVALHRGPYTIGAVLDEASSSEPLQLQGRFVNLFSPQLDIVENPSYEPGEVFFLRKLGQDPPAKLPVVIAGNVRVEAIDEVSSDVVRLVAHGPESPAPGILRLHVRSKPIEANVLNKRSELTARWSEPTKSLYLSFRSRPAGTRIELKFKPER